MPHKRAKRSVREAETAARGSDNAPTSNDTFHSERNKDTGGVSKTVYRILNAERIRNDRRTRDAVKKNEKKRPHEDDDKPVLAATHSKRLKIKPGEDLKSFNK